MSNRLARAALLFVYLSGLILPGVAFFSARGGLDVLNTADAQVFFRIAFPFTGLYAFTFVTFQVLLAANLRWIQTIWPNAVTFHRFQGLFAFLFATLHPLFILLGYGGARFFTKAFVAESLKGYVFFGQAAWVLMALTVTTAFLAWRGMNLPIWRRLHRLNYLVFALAWTHSWFIGSDTRAGNLRLLWLTYLTLVVISIAFKYRYKFLPQGAGDN